MNNIGIGRRSFSVGLGALALAGARAAHSQSDGRIVLGQSAPLTGPAAQLGIQFRAGALVGFEQYNSQASGRRTVELRTLDDGYEPERCAANTHRFIDDEVTALFGYIGTPTSLAALPIFTQAKVPFFAPFTGTEALRQPFNRLIFHVRASYFDETALIVRQLTNLGLSKIAVFYQNDSYGKAGLEGVERALAARKLKSVAQGAVERNSNDVAAAVQSIVAGKPEAVVQICAYQASAEFIRQARKAGYGGTFYNVSFVGTQALSDALGKDAAGVVVSQVVPSPTQSSRPITREFAEAIRKAGGKVQANYSSLEGYIAARVFCGGLREVPQATATGRALREPLIGALEALGAHPVAGFQVAFGAGNHQGSRFVEMSMLAADGRVRV